MSNFPDSLGRCPSLFPTKADLAAEARSRLAERQAAALARVEAVAGRIEGYLVADDAADADECALTEALAADLEAVEARHFPRSHSARGIA